MRTTYSPTHSPAAVQVSGARNTPTAAPRCSRMNGTARSQSSRPTFGWGTRSDGSNADTAVEMERLRYGRGDVPRPGGRTVSDIGRRGQGFPPQNRLSDKNSQPRSGDAAAL